jgi:hypothetical protein
MNTQFKVRQKVKVITASTGTDLNVSGWVGEIIEVQSDNFIGIRFENYPLLYCFSDDGITLNVEILQSDKFSATIEFRGDMSVGIRSYYYTMDLDANLIEVFADDKAYREELRAKIQALYTEIDNDMKCHVIFSDETIQP